MATNKAAMLNEVVERYLQENAINVTPAHGVDNLAMAISLVASTRALALLPEYANNLLPWSVVSRPLGANSPSIDLAIGYSKANTSPILKHFLCNVGKLTDGATRKRRRA